MTELFMIAGPAGSGKTTLGVALAERWGVPWLDLDPATADLVARFLEENPEITEAQALALLRERRYEELAAQARRVVDDGPAAVVVIAPFTAEIGSAVRWEAWAESVGVGPASAHLIWLALPPGERLSRMAARGASRDSELLEETRAGQELSPPTGPVVDCFVVDALLPTALEIDLVVQRFGNGPFRV